MSHGRRSWPHQVLARAARRCVDARLLTGRAADEWDALARAAGAHGAHGWLARELRGRAEVPREFQLGLQATAARIAAAHARRVEEARAALSALAQGGIPALVLKGPALVERYYADVALRPYGDVDVYVRARDFRAAVARLESAGFAVADRNWDLLVRDLRGQLHLERPGGGPVELHWHLINGRRHRRTLRMGLDEMWDAAYEGTVAGAPCMLASTEDEIAHLCLHAAMHGCNRLVWLLDIALIAARPELDWAATVDRLSRWRFGPGGYLVLALAEAWAGAWVPLAKLRRIRPGPGARVAFARLVARGDLGGPPSSLAELFFATAGEGLRARAGLAADFVIPAPGQRGHAHASGWRQDVHRLTVGTARRVVARVAGGRSDTAGTEYRPAGDPSAGRDAYLRAVDTLAAGR